MLFNKMLQNAGITTIEDKSTDLLAQFGLNWEVKKESLLLPSGQQSGFYGIVRQDTQKTFATCKEGYEVFQNAESLTLVNEAANNLGLSVNRGGMFKEGGLVFLQLENGQVSGIGQNNDTIKKYVSAMNSHDGSLSLKWGLTNITISCRNTFWAAVREMKNTVKHTESMRLRIETIMNQIKAVQKTEEDLFKIFFKFAEVPATKAHIAMAVKSVLDIDLLGGTRSNLTSYQVNRMNDLSASIQKEINQKGNTLWGLFSGVTNYTTHKMPGGDVNRQQSKAIGLGYKVDNEVFAEFAEIVK